MTPKALQGSRTVVRPAAAARPPRPQAAPRAVKPVRPPQRPITRSVGAPVTPTAASGTDPAQAYIDASIGPALQQIAYERQQQQTQDQQRAAAISNYTRQFLGYLSQVPGQVQQDYGNMLTQQDSLGREADAALTAASPNAADQQQLQAIGAPAAQQQQVADKLNSAFAGGGAVLYGTGSYIPGNRISREEAAQLAYTRGLPAITASRGAQVLQQMLAGSQSAYNNLSEQEAQIYAGVPKMRLDYQSSLASNDAKQQQLALERAALGLKGQNQAFTQKATVARINQGAARVGISQGQLALGQKRLDASTKIALARLGLAQNAQQISAAKAIQKQSAQKRWLGYGANLYSKKMQAAAGAASAMKQGFTDKAGNVHPPLTWGQALQEMQSEGIPPAMAIPVLSHYYPPGIGGRPAKGVWAILASMGLHYAATPTGAWYPGSKKQPNRPPR